MGREWFVLAASVVINCLMKGSLKSLGVVLEQLNRQGIDPSKSSWIPAIGYTLFACLSTPVARLPSILAPRWIAALGGAIASIGFLLAAVTSSLPLLYLGLGGALGSGGCLATIIGVLEINKRFTGKRRGLAHGWSLAGNTLGGLLLPGSLALLFDQWGRAGALAIHSAVLLNIVPATLFYSSHVVTVEEREEERTERTNQGKVWSNPRFWFCIFSMASTTIGYTNFGLYLPLHLTSCLGLSPTTAASFLSLFALGDLTGRLTGPALSDRAPPRWLWYCAALAGAGVAIAMVSTLSGLVEVAAAILVAGLLSGVMVGTYPALLSDELGAENLAVTYPLSQTLAGLLNLAGPPLLGLLASRVDTSTVMLVLGASLVSGAAPLALASIIRPCFSSAFAPVSSNESC